ncbi:DUF72 domain-containing protein [Nocardioides sp. zg-ZUI104]|uniref:DUF72 domain-containing protein n=1 Tax=Nocardioides faecalis TaxID=2803858 RepID=UPI001BCDD887|nr:DUF72 domain-containing protein [Nocardioides faecalis]MBS4752509.1 DUF72 domain-containing protein [Nocardioides faecalis]
MASGRLLIGTSGWSYAAWRGGFYPDGLRQRDELRFLSERTTASEVNATFYRLQRPTTFQRWYDDAAPSHLLAIKGSRYVTHLKQLRDPLPGLANFFASGVLALRERLDVVLWQLPARLHCDPALLEEFLAVLPRTAGEAAALAARHDDRLTADRTWLEPTDPGARIRHALEPRHTSYGSPEALDVLSTHDVALVHSDSPGAWPVLEADTASFRYVRLHGHSTLYASRYSDRLLDTWAERCAAWSAAGMDVHVYFDNDARGHAPHDAVRLLQRLGAAPEPASD